MDTNPTRLMQMGCKVVNTIADKHQQNNLHFGINIGD